MSASATIARRDIERGNARQLVVVREDDDKVIGTLLLFNFDPGSARPELGYVLGRAHWGRGLMRETLQAMCTFAFGSFGIRRLEAEVNSSNVASIRLLRCLGFMHAGCAVGVYGFLPLGAAVHPDMRATRSIRAGDAGLHRRWMIRNSALTFAAVTLRLWLPASVAAGIRFAVAYPVVAWLCWVPNLLAVELLLQRTHDASLRRSTAGKPAGS